tara:strand:+ start:777 stop:1541 length:765 start_codon:yes stop_codon:yes gene_type:complete
MTRWYLSAVSKEMRAMPEEVCPDVARELLKKLVFVCVRDNDLVLAVRSAKAFRAVNVTFRDAFEDDKTGCKMLARYTRKLIVSKKRRIVGIDNLTKLHDNASRAVGWMQELRHALQRDTADHTRYFAALGYKIDNRVLGDWEVCHRACLPATDALSLRRGGGCETGGLPSGPWHLTATGYRRAPHGTCECCEALLMKVKYDEAVGGMSQREWAERTTGQILGIGRADEDATVQQHVASVGQMLHRLGIADEPTE